jgi:hypothetical protein
LPLRQGLRLGLHLPAEPRVVKSMTACSGNGWGPGASSDRRH